MSNDQEKDVAADHGQPRPSTVDEDRYTLSIDEAIDRYEAAGIPRIRRTIQRYCSNKTLDAHRFAIPYGEKYLITPESLERHIAYVLQGEAAMADRGEPRPDMAADIQPAARSLMLRESDQDEGAGVIDMLRDENKFLKEQITVKDAQLAVKDRQIADQSERARETNLLVASLHKLITPLIGQGGRFDFSAPVTSASDADDIHPPRQ